jgi:regulation of enolase protein 1 (concanavalin A-like superfamily)
MKKDATHKILIIIILTLTQISCDSTENQSSKANEMENMENNMLANITIGNLGDFKWLNEPKSYEIENGKLKVVAEKETDFFNNPEDKKKTSTAPVLFKEINGNFVARALVRPDFTSLWSAVALMVHIDNDNWIKFAFENSDATGKSIVSVVTKNVSDDANGAILSDQDQIWLKVVRKENIYSMHWSENGKDFKMCRLSTMAEADSVKIGIEVQSPVGESATHQIDYFEIEKITVKDLRKGE